MMTSCGFACSSADGRRARPSALTSPGTPAATTLRLISASSRAGRSGCRRTGAPPRRAQGEGASAGRHRRLSAAPAERARCGESSSGLLRPGQARAFLEDTRAAGGADGELEPREPPADRLAPAAEDVFDAELRAV